MGTPWFFYKNLYKKQFLKENNLEFPDYWGGEDPSILGKCI